MTELTEWTTPELTVLVRNQPEEAVLETCKDNNQTSITGPGRGNVPPNTYCTLSGNPLGTGNPKCSDIVTS